MFFRRRSRANSYVEDTPAARRDSQTYDKYDRPVSESHVVPIAQHNTQAELPPAPIEIETKDMYQRPQAPQEPYGSQRITNGINGSHNALPVQSAPAPLNVPLSAPAGADLLMRAFNETVRPYTEKIEQLENEVADLRAWIEQLEQERREVHSWIDKRGLRPDVPASIAKVMDTPTTDSAATLNAQLDRKITIVNFDLHRLQDDLNDSISSSHFAAAMLKFLPDINRLSLLPSGPRYAFDLILKLGGNLNSHGGLDSGDADDLAARRDFYARLDSAMVDVVRRRFAENDEWQVGREIKRIQKTAEYVKSFGIEPYFPATMQLMLREQEYKGTGSMGGVQPLNTRESQNGMNANGGPMPQQTTPPRYQ